MLQGVLAWWWCRDGLVGGSRLLVLMYLYVVLRHLYLVVRDAAIPSITCSKHHLFEASLVRSITCSKHELSVGEQRHGKEITFKYVPCISTRPTACY